MPIRPYLEGATFNPEVIQLLSEAYQATCRVLGLIDRADPMTEIVAKKIIEIAKRGERDPLKIRQLVLKELGAPAAK
jgi:hypothetical protein